MMPHNYRPGRVIVLLMALFMALSGMAQDKSKSNNRVALTFENLPSENYYSKEERLEITEFILAALNNHDAKATGLVIGDYVAGDWDQLVMWLADGHNLGFQTFSGQTIYDAPPKVFIGDIDKGREAIEDMLQVYKIKNRYFRYPLLHYGDDYQAKQDINAYLDSNGIKVAHATILVEDFVYNLSLENLLKRHDSAGIARLRDEYLEHILAAVAHAEDLSREMIGRQVRHIMQLRANRINGYFLDDVLATLKDKGYKFISLGYALKDKVYKKTDNYYGHKVVSWLERIREPEVEQKK